jgi:hypothetical protein
MGAVHQHHVGGVDGHVRARADGDAHVRPFQRRCVVYPVAHHGHPALLLQRAYGGLLAVRQHARYDLVHSGSGPHGSGRALVVAGDHHHAYAHAAKLTYGLGAVGLGLVRHGDKSQRFAVPAEKQRRFSLGGKLIRRCSSAAGTWAQVLMNFRFPLPACRRPAFWQ